jgi:hypothetical protein
MAAVLEGQMELLEAEWEQVERWFQAQLGRKG